jgi:ferredoxin-NADP reductase
MPERPLLQATLKRSTSLSQQTKHLEFEADGIECFDFIAGQFISIVVPNQHGKNVTRAYSIASPPRRDRTFDICLNRVQDGFMSNYLCDLEPGKFIPWHGPHGLFTLREPVKDSIFIATGTGIAPMRSMLQWLFADEARHRDHDFWLVYGTRYEVDIYYRDEFEKMARERPNFHYTMTLSRGDESWKGLRGYVQERVREVVSGRPNNGVGDMTAYICGLNDMVSATRELLTSFGWDKRQIIYERYD